MVGYSHWWAVHHGCPGGLFITDARLHSSGRPAVQPATRPASAGQHTLLLGLSFFDWCCPTKPGQGADAALAGCAAYKAALRALCYAQGFGMDACCRWRTLVWPGPRTPGRWTQRCVAPSTNSCTQLCQHRQHWMSGQEHSFGPRGRAWIATLSLVVLQHQAMGEAGL